MCDPVLYRFDPDGQWLHDRALRQSVKHVVLSAALVLLALGRAAPAADQSSPAASNVPGAATPTIHPDGSITFALKARTMLAPSRLRAVTDSAQARLR